MLATATLSATVPPAHSSAGLSPAPPAPALSILDFGGKADGVFNNHLAIRKAMAACAAAGGCTLTFPLPKAGERVVPPMYAGPAPYHPYGPPVQAVYRTSAINLTSSLHLVIPTGVQLRGTEDTANNCGGTDSASCDDLDSPTWPVLPWMAYPSPPNIGGGRLAKQAFIRCYNCRCATLPLAARCCSCRCRRP